MIIKIIFLKEIWYIVIVFCTRSYVNRELV